LKNLEYVIYKEQIRKLLTFKKELNYAVSNLENAGATTMN